MSKARTRSKPGREYLTLTVDQRTVALLSSIAAERGLSRGRIVDEAIRAELLRPKCCETCERAEDRGDGRCERHGRLLAPMGGT